MNPTTSRLLVALAVAALFAGGLAACATNPATGQRQISLIGEQQEIALGRDADREIVGSLGLYPDDDLQRYVDDVGQRLAASSERPDLPWTFRVVDDPTVNAFALPGGYIYVTRGILGHLVDEAELASVIGHEIGHVTGRHGVERLSKAQLAGLGLGVGAVLSPEFRRFGDLAQAGVGLLFLKYSRDDEREADHLGLRYLQRGTYDPRRMPEVFAVLRRVGEAAGGGRVPGWLATHPDPERRYETISGEIAGLGGDFSGARVGRPEYFAAIDGVVFGEDPREGFFEGATFYQPAMGFRLRFPEGWTTSNQKQAVSAVSPEKDAAISLSLAQADTPAAAAQAFLAQQGIEDGGRWQPGLSGLSAAGTLFAVPRTDGEKLVGAAAFVEHGGQVFQLLGYTGEARWPARRSALEATLESFARVTDRRILDVQPARLEVVKLPEAMTLEEFSRRYPSTVDDDTLARINQLERGARPAIRLAAGTEVKRVVGGRRP